MLTFLEDIPVGSMVNVLWEVIILGISLYAPTKKRIAFFYCVVLNLKVSAKNQAHKQAAVEEK